MFLRFRLPTLIVLLLLISGGLRPAAAQEFGAWFTYLYNGNSHEIVRLDTNGSTQAYSLGLAEQDYVSATQMAFTPDGARVAFCYTRFAANAADNVTRLIVRDVAAQTNIVDLDLGAGVACQTTQNSFNDDYTRVAIGKVNYSPAMPDADTSGPSWQLLVVDTASGAVVASLDEASGVSFGDGFYGGVLPLVRAFNGSSVIFNAIPFATDARMNLPTFIWDTATGSVTPEASARFAEFGGDLLEATGESVWFTADSSLPAGQPMGPIPLYNVVRYAANGAEPTSIFHDPDEIIMDVAFIDDGARLGVVVLGSFDPNNPNEPPPYRWFALDRAGNVQDLGGGVTGYANIFALPGGYGVLAANFSMDSSQTTTELIYGANGTASVLWSSNTGGWEVAFAPPITQVAPDLPPFAAFSMQ